MVNEPLSVKVPPTGIVTTKGDAGVIVSAPPSTWNSLKTDEPPVEETREAETDPLLWGEPSPMVPSWLKPTRKLAVPGLPITVNVSENVAPAAAAEFPLLQKRAAAVVPRVPGEAEAVEEAAPD